MAKAPKDPAQCASLGGASEGGTTSLGGASEDGPSEVSLKVAPTTFSSSNTASGDLERYSLSLFHFFYL